MPTEASALQSIFEGWDSHQDSLVRAVAPRTCRELAFRPAPKLRSVGELASHLSLGRIGWFARMGAPGSAALARDADGWAPEAVIVEDAAELVRRLEVTWRMIADTLAQWTIGDLA